MLIELFWLGLGLVLLLAAWRGVARREKAADDAPNEEDEDEGNQVTRPMQRPAQVRAVSTFSRQVLPEAALTSPTLSPLPISKTAGWSAPTSAAVSQTSAPKPLELFASRSYAVLVATVLTLFTISSAYTALALASVFGQAFMLLLMTPVMLAYGLTMVQCVRNFFWTGPVLVLDRFGITNYRKGGHRVPWTEVDGVSLYATNASTYLVLRFRHAGDVHTHFGKKRWLQAIGRHFFYKGFEGWVKLTSLWFKRAEVLQTAQAFLRHSRR